MSLCLVGLGPSPLLLDLTRRAERCLCQADRVYLDDTTAGGWQQRHISLRESLSCAVELLGPLDSSRCDELLGHAHLQKVVVASAGDALVATPLHFLCRRARERGVACEIIPGLSMMTAAVSLLGLDASTSTTVVINDLDQPSAFEATRLQQALNSADTVVVLAAGREAEPVAEAWNKMRVELQQHSFHVETVSIDAGGTALVLTNRSRPKVC
jgi:uroporphyrin-III C-methyltransferase